MRLEPADHALAIQTYSQRLTQLERKLRLFPDSETTEILLDEARRSQNLRKIHVHALHEQLWVEAEVVDGTTAVAA
ncbi:hypothetical protein [Hymenobacter amundsenii]|nr:hypothetical protein [Hymenobacter amundsenii]